MICADCAAAADFFAMPGLLRAVAIFADMEAAEGHLRCEGRGSGCACQHRVPAKHEWRKLYGRQEVES